MKPLLIIVIVLAIVSCNGKHEAKFSIPAAINQQDLKNEKIVNYRMLEGMYLDTYFPKSSVDKVKAVLIEFCYSIEQDQPKNLEELDELSHQATDKINNLQSDFSRNGSEIETAAREIIAMDFEFISTAYGFKADVEELIANRDW